MTPIAVILWTCVAVFISTAVISLLALIGILKLGGGTVKDHQYYSKRLFLALIVEVVGTGVLIFYDQTRTTSLNAMPAQFVDLQAKVDSLTTRVARIEKIGTDAQARPVGPRWELVRMGADCAGMDQAMTQGETPEPVNGQAGTIAVCWDGKLFRNGVGAWCTYKRTTPEACVGGTAPAS
jgi:hypothetical protein